MSADLVAIVPQPGTDLVPDGWCDDVFVPWLDAQGDPSRLRPAAAQLDGYIAEYKTLKADIFELVKARRHLELRLGELLGPTTSGARTDLEPSLAGEGLDKDDRYRFRKLARNAERVREHLATATDAEDLSLTAVLRTAVGTRFGSGDDEWFTPAKYIDAARAVMGGIDLDPASTEEANTVVKAERFYTVADDGLRHPWAGRVFMNPPYSQPLVAQFCGRLVDQYRAAKITEAVTLVNNATETVWFQNLAEACSAICFPRSRIQFRNHNKASSPLQGQAVLYLGPNAAEFCHVFAEFGFVAEHDDEDDEETVDMVSDYFESRTEFATFFAELLTMCPEVLSELDWTSVGEVKVDRSQVLAGLQAIQDFVQALMERGPN